MRRGRWVRQRPGRAAGGRSSWAIGAIDRAAIREGRTTRGSRTLLASRGRRTQTREERVRLGGLRVHGADALLQTREGEERGGVVGGASEVRGARGGASGEFERTRATRTGAGAPSAGGSEGRRTHPSRRTSRPRSRGRGTRRRRGGACAMRARGQRGRESQFEPRRRFQAAGCVACSTSCWLSARVDLFPCFGPARPRGIPRPGRPRPSRITPPPASRFPTRLARCAPRRRRASPGARPRPRPAPRRGATRPRPRASRSRASARHVDAAAPPRRRTGGSSAPGDASPAPAPDLDPPPPPGRRPRSRRARPRRRRPRRDRVLVEPAHPRGRRHRLHNLPSPSAVLGRVVVRRARGARARAYRSKRLDEALDLLTRIVALEPEDGQWYERRAQVLVDLKRFREPWTISTPPSPVRAGVPLSACW